MSTGKMKTEREAQPPVCEYPDGDETREGWQVDCVSCEDEGFTVTPGGWKIPCFDCERGDQYLYHEREKTLAEMVHVDELLPGVDPEYEGE